MRLRESCELRDIDSDFRKPQGEVKTKLGQGHWAETEANWGQKSNSGTDKCRNKFPAHGGNSSGQGGRSGRGSNDRRSGNDRAAASKSGEDVTCYCCGKKGHIKPNCPKRSEECRQCGKVGHLQTMCKSKSEGGSSSGNKGQGEASLSEEYDGFACTVTIGSVEAMIGDAAATKTKFSDIYLGDIGVSHRIKSSSAGMIKVTKCPPDTKIRQVQGTVDVEEWGSVLLQVDGSEGKRVIRLDETLIVPSIIVNLFS